VGLEFATLVVISTDYIGSCKSNVSTVKAESVVKHPNPNPTVEISPGCDD
jgi:hypothetical protein